MPRLTIAARHPALLLVAVLPAVGDCGNDGHERSRRSSSLRDGSPCPRSQRRSASTGSSGRTSRCVGATHSSEVLNRVPGVMVQRGSGQESLTAIRSPGAHGRRFLRRVPVPRERRADPPRRVLQRQRDCSRSTPSRRTRSRCCAAPAPRSTVRMPCTARSTCCRTRRVSCRRASWDSILGPGLLPRGSLVAAHDGARLGTGLKALRTRTTAAGATTRASTKASSTPR